MADNFFSNVVDRLFGKSDDGGSDKVPFVSEQLSRSARFKAAFAEWRNSERFSEVLDTLRREHHEAKKLGLAHQAFQLYETPQSNGFYFNAATGLAPEEFAYLLEHFREVTEGLGYRQQIADRRMSERGADVHATERIYLKPDLLAGFDPPLDQLYGNVHLELVLLNEQPSYLKVMAHVYQDRNYKSPRSFDGFTEKLFAESAS
ncbi:MAG: hypothetical protein ABR572_04070 [Cryomorphaceae bacterium]